MSKEGITQRGVGVEYKKNVSTRHDRANVSPKDGKPGYEAGTKAAFKQACMDTKKG